MTCHIWVLTLKSYLRIPWENCLMSFTMNITIDRVISVCHLDVLDSLFLNANASCNRNCPLPLLTLCCFSPLASSTPTLTFFYDNAMLPAEMVVHGRCRTCSILKFALTNFTHSNCFVYFCVLCTKTEVLSNL